MKLKYKLFETFSRFEGDNLKTVQIDEQINEFNENPLIEIYDIKLTSSTYDTEITYSALVSYYEHVHINHENI